MYDNCILDDAKYYPGRMRVRSMVVDGEVVDRVERWTIKETNAVMDQAEHDCRDLPSGLQIRF